MNRYSQITTSEFNPLSFQEIMAAPLAMRQKHDNAIVATEAMRIKADPLIEHSARALEIKNQMDAEIAKNVDILNKEGYNPTTFQNITKLNRQYQDMISPTGEIGIINAAKIAEAKAKEDFMKNADKSFGQNVLEQKWLEHRQKYANVNGRDKDGKIINIDNLGSPKYVDLDTGIRDVLSTLGSTTKEKLLNSGLHFKNTDYGPVMVNAQGSIVTETNDKQLDDALNALKTRFINKTGEGRISRDFEGRTADEDLAYINSRISAANVYKQNKDYKTNYDMISTGGSGDGKEKTPMLNDAIQDPNSIKNLNKNTGEIDFSQIGSKVYKGSFDNLFKKVWEPKHGDGKVPNHYKDVLSPIQQKFYETAAKRLIASKRLPKDADLNNTANAEKIGFYMKNYMKFPTVATDIIRADVAIDNQLFSGNLASKDQNSRNATLTQDLRQTKDGKPLRTMLDVESGGKVKLEEGDTIDYLGVESPINYSSYGFENKNEQSVMGHRAQVLDSKGNVKANVVISRTPNEMDDPTFKKMYEISHTYKNGLNNLGNWVRPTGNYSKSKELSKAKVRVNDNNTFQIQIDGYPISKELSNEEFIRDMNKIMEY